MALDNELLNAGKTHHVAGRFQQALDIYRRLLESEPQNALLYNLLGAVSINLQQWPEAGTYLQEALRLNPTYSAVHDNLGVLLTTQNRFAEAVLSYRRALELDRNSAQTWMNLANALLHNGQPLDAIEPFQMVTRLAPDSLRAHAEVAKLLFGYGRRAESIPHFRKVTQLKPDDPQVFFELGDALAQDGQVAESIAAYHDTLRLKPTSAEACVNLSFLYIKQSAYDEAIRWARRAIELRPNFAEAHLNLGCALTRTEKYAEAIVALRRAAALKPNMPESFNNLGIALAGEGNFSEAADTYRQSLAISENPEALYNLGIALHKQGDQPAALEHFTRSLELRPDYAEAHHNRSAVLLLMGRLSEGLPEYEWRFHSKDFPPYTLRWPVWDGGPIEGRTIALCAEQGLGDTLQFIRYARLVKQLGARVMVECSKTLHPILARTPHIDGWITAETPGNEVDVCVPMMSLPCRLHTTLETIPVDIPYVFANESLLATWRQRLAEFPGFKVGIVWQGNPQCPGDRNRSIALSHYAALARVPGVRLVNLQKGPGLDQLDEFRERWGVIDFGDEVDKASGAFMDTAAIMKCLDLVITSDTAPAHLAGALGADVWVPLQKVPDWRFLLDREDSPWYPSMRLFRQQELNVWPDVFARMGGELARLVAARPTR